VLFQPSGRRGQIAAGKTVLQAAQELGVVLESICGGEGICGKCKVRLEEGLFDRESLHSHKRHLSDFQPQESEGVSEAERAKGYRLACLATLQGDVQIYVPEETQGKSQVIRKDAGDVAIQLDPGVKAYALRLPQPSLQEPLADFERLLRGLTAYGLKDVSIAHSALQKLPVSLRAGNWEVTAFVWMDRLVLDVLPGTVEDYYGVAVDIGTTTVAAYLCNLRNGELVGADSIMNPQVIYGEDVMARITHAMMNAPEGLRRMREAITAGLNDLIHSVAASRQIVPEHIFEMTVVGNTAMHHIFLGINPEHVGVSPFPPAIHHSLDLKARDLGIRIHPEANVHILPIEAGFVGADNVGVLICETPYQKDEIALIIDVGTNGELVLGNRRRVASSSCATGPALEGAHLQFGMRAAPGAIERVRIDPKTFRVRYKVIGREEWSDQLPPAQIQARGICGSGVIEAVAEMFAAGILDTTGRIQENPNNPRLRNTVKGPAFVIAEAAETAIGQDITISIPDVRAVQLAKGALYAGAKIMMKTLGVERLDKVVLAGGFGSYIDPLHAMILGMFPDCGLKNVITVGNAAGDGARIALLDRKKRAEADEIARQVGYIELTICPDFTAEFAEAMYFPHMVDEFPSLASLLNHPDRPAR
jgi:uncharacterized 2Fe-2S/4Fe-4S cluster protein (DUF4445 family)